MKNRAIAVLALSILVPVSAASADIVFPVDIELDNGLLGQNLFFMTEVMTGELTQIEWDLNFESSNGSSGSEVVMNLLLLGSPFQVEIDGSDGNITDLSPATIDLGWSTLPGDQSSTGAAIPGVDVPVLADTAGTWSLVIFDEFDNPGGIDGHLTGTITISNTPVPAPGAIALLGIAGLTGRRRRRH